MSTGSGTGAPVTAPSLSRVYGELATVADVRARFGTDTDELTDAGIRADLDRMQSSLEAALGHGFGRVAWLWAMTTVQVQITATKLTIAGTDYAFATYTTLADLALALVNAGYYMELAPHVRPDTPSTLLRTLALSTCGPTIDKRVALTTSALYYRATGGESHLFLPLPVASVVSVVETGTTLTSSNYWTQLGQPWLIRKACACSGDDCFHNTGRWKGTYPDNVIVTYTPMWWGTPPAAAGAVLLDAFGAARGFTLMQSEDFLSYSYTRSIPEALRWEQIVAGAGLRPYQVRAVF